MKILFIDTHSEKITMIVKNGNEKFVEEVSSERSHSEVAVLTLEKILNKANILVNDLDQIIVVNGPGSFTGVRIGVTIAKGIAYSLNIPIKTITSLEMYGVSSQEDFDIVAISDSKGMYTALYNEGKYSDFKYQKNSFYKDYIQENDYKVLESKVIDLDKIIEYLKEHPEVNPHLVNPIYIKEIDALK